jgi:Uncharacterised nucleotidyltransferase
MDQANEAELLLSCLRVGAASSGADKLARLSGQDWDGVMQQAARHEVIPLLYQHLKGTSRSATVPPSVMERLREGALRNAVRNLLLYRELSTVLRAYWDDGIPVIVLKGAYLAEVVYADRALRPMLDMDFLIRATDLPRAETKLLEMGYGRLEQPDYDVNYATHHHLQPFVKPVGVKIELHRTIGHSAGAFNIDVEGLWQRARPAAIADVEALTLAPEDLLLHLCLHASFDHQFLFGLRPFCDLSEAIRHHRDHIDWEQVQYRARQWGVGKYIYLMLYLARELLAADVPGGVLDTLKPEGFDPQVIVWAKAQIFSNDIPSLSPNFTQFWGAKRFRQKLALSLKVVLPPVVVLTRMYRLSSGSRYIYFYYPVRWRDLLLQYSRSVWCMMWRDKETLVLAEREHQKIALREWLQSGSVEAKLRAARSED